MREYPTNRSPTDRSFDVHSLLKIGQGIAGAIGLFIMLVGLFYALRTFGLIYTALHEPAEVSSHLDKWTETVGGDDLKITLNNETYHPARIVAIIVLGGGAFILAWISMGLVIAGAKTVALATGDAAAVKKILRHTLGPASKGANPSDESK